MIDYVHLSHSILLADDVFDASQWHIGVTDDGKEFYWHTYRGVKIRYYPHQNKLTIKGKILMLLYNTQVFNVDDVYGRDIDLFVEDVNGYLNGLLTQPLLDIRRFHVYRIDYCFNVGTPYVEEYIAFWNDAFKITNRGNRVNHVQEKKLSGSVYVKTGADYRQKRLKNYTLNFYNKLDCLQKRKLEGQHIPAADFGLAQDVLRLEVQCGSQFLRQLRKEVKAGDAFGELCSFRIARRAIEMVYGRVFKGAEELDYYTYKAAKMLQTREPEVQKTLYAAATNRKIMEDKYRKGLGKIKATGVYPYCFLDRDGGVEVLENPLKLIQRKLDGIGAVWR